MTPGEMQLLRTMLRDEMDSALVPVRAEQAAQGLRIGKLETSDRARSGQHKAVTKELIPRAISDSRVERDGEIAGMTAAFTKMAESIERIEENIHPRSLVELPDGKGGRSVRPASLVAAESSVRTENVQNGMARVMVDAAIETTQAKNSAVAAQAWQKKVVTPLLVIMPLLAEIVRTVIWPILFPHTSP